MFVRTPSDFGAVIRDRRKKLDLDQAGLAERISVNRKWVIGIERGRVRAELGLVLRALDALGIRLDASADEDAGCKGSATIDTIVSAARKGKP